VGFPLWYPKALYVQTLVLYAHTKCFSLRRHSYDNSWCTGCESKLDDALSAPLTLLEQERMLFTYDPKALHHIFVKVCVTSFLRCVRTSDLYAQLQDQAIYEPFVR
jgi:hypothetical protein